MCTSSTATPAATGGASSGDDERNASAGAAASRPPRARPRRPPRRHPGSARPPGRARPRPPRGTRRARVRRGRPRGRVTASCPRAARRCRRRAAGSARPRSPPLEQRGEVVGAGEAPHARGEVRVRLPAGQHPAQRTGTSTSNQSRKNGRRIPRGRVISSTASLPPGRSTRASSRRPPSRSARFRTPKPTVAASNSPSANGSASASPCTHSIAPDFLRARSSIFGEKSSPSTRPPRRSASTARSPVPQHASSTRSPGHTTSATASLRQRRSSPAVITRFITS